MKFIFLFVVLLWNAHLVAKISIRFLVPSGATTEISRFYSYQLNKMMKEYRDLDIIFMPKKSYDNVLKEVITLNQDKKAWIAIIEISELLTLKDEKAILPLNELISKSEFKGDLPFLDQFVQEFLGNSYGDDGKIYGLPIFRSTPIVYYNLDMINKMGIETTTLPRTWSEFKALLMKIKKKRNRPPFGLASTWYEWIFESFVMQNKGSLANSTNTKLLLDSEPVIGALEFWSDLNKNGLIERSTGSWKSTLHNFVMQSYPCVYYSTGGMSHVLKKAKFRWTTTIMPGNPDFGTTVGGGNIFISKHVNKGELKKAWDIVNFLLRPSVQGQLSSTSGYFPVVKEAFNLPELKIKYSKDERFIQAKKQLEFSKAKIMTRNFTYIRKVLKKAIDSVLDDNMSPKEALKNAQNVGEMIIK